MKQYKAAFTDYLSAENLKMTNQRRLILDTFLEKAGHVSPEELYEAARERDASLGQATVYRTLKLLVEAGLATALDFGDGVTRYEPVRGEEHHDHLICEGCGKNLEILDQEIERLQEELAARYGFELSHHRMYLFGLCPQCRKKKDKKES